MGMCEKCWGDAYLRAYLTHTKSQTEYYFELIEERKDNPCTPEQQAGGDAELCTKCNRKSIHQITGECMNCGYEMKK